MSVSRRQFFALVGAGAAATLLPLPQLAQAETESAPKLAIDNAKGRTFRVMEVRFDCFSDSSVRMHVEAVQTDGYMGVAFDMATESQLRPGDILYIDMEKLYDAWPPPMESNRGDSFKGLSELTLTMPSLAEREAVDAWRDEQ